MGTGARTTTADVLELTKKFGMSLLEAAATEVPCGKTKGGLMGNEGGRSIWWFATRLVSTKTSKPMRDAICAARIIRASRQLQTSNEHPVEIEADAKRAHMICQHCGKSVAIPRLHLGRAARPKCFGCGGTLIETDPPVDDYISIREASEEYGVSKYAIRVLPDVLSKKGRGKWLVGRASLEAALRRRAELQNR